jgi:uncharacterized membrane protein
MEAFVIKSWCIVCVMSQTVIIFIFASVLMVIRNERSRNRR